MSVKYLASYTTRAEAESARALLEDNGINSLVQISPRGGALIGTVGITNGESELFVESSRLEEAREVLNAYNSKAGMQEFSVATVAIVHERGLFRLIAVILLLIFTLPIIGIIVAEFIL